MRLLAKVSGRTDLVFDELAKQATGRKGDRLGQLVALDTMLELMESDETYREAGVRVLMDRLLDPEMTPADAMLLADQLLFADQEAAFDVASALLVTETEPQKVEHVIPLLGWPPPGKEQEARTILMSYPIEDAPVSVQKSVLVSLARMGKPEDILYIQQAASGGPEEVAAYAGQLLDRLLPDRAVEPGNPRAE